MAARECALPVRPHPYDPAPLMSRILTFSLVALATTVLSAQPSAQPPERFAEESFAYRDGDLREVSGRTWARVEGRPAIAVERREAVLGPFTEGSAGYLVRRFSRQPTGPVFEVMFALRVDAPVAGEVLDARGETFLQLAGNEGRARRGRVALRAAPGGQAYRLGVSSRSWDRVRWAPQELAPGEVHLVRMVYDSSTGGTWLWINPRAPGEPPHATAQEDDTAEIDRLALQTGPRLGNARVRIARVVVQRGEVPVITADMQAPEPAAPIAPPPAAAAATAPSGPGPGMAVAPLPRRERLWVFVLAGQSNMAGRGPVDAVDTTSHPRILKWQRDGTWAPAVEPLHDDKPRVAGVGPGLAFARALLAHVPDDVKIGLVPAAYGGSRIARWRRNYVGRDRWEHGPTYYQHLVASAQAASRDGVLKAILWNQGESDASAAEADAGAAYRAELHTLIGHLREDLGKPDLPFVAATLGPWRADRSSAINRVILALPAEVPATAVVDTLAVTPPLQAKPDDPSHYDSPSARRLGEHYAEALRPLLGPE